MAGIIRLSLALVMALVPRSPDPGRIDLEVVEEGGGKVPACRFHVADALGKPVRPKGLPFWRDHFVCPGKVTLELAAGSYSYEVERGPEWSRASGTIVAIDGAQEKKVLTLKRIADLKKEGWWSGDLHVHRALEEAELHAEAEDLHIEPVITWWNKTNPWSTKPIPEELLRRTQDGRFIFQMAGEDEREGGALMFFHLPKPLEITKTSREYPSPMTFVLEAKKTPGVHIDIEKPFWWDVPIWVASGEVDTIGLANNHMCRSQMSEKEAWGRPRDAGLLPPPLGNGFWTQEIYYHLLNSGLRLPPSAGSASGVLPNPVGYNRVYVQTGPELTWEKWWEGLRAGRSFVTNGPLLRVLAGGRPPGTVFSSEEAKELTLEARLTSKDKVPQIEIVRDGTVLRAVKGEELEKTGSLGTLRFEKSGWFLVRAIAEEPRTFRFASTAPFYVEIGSEKRRVSRASAKFFLGWVDERRARVKEPDEAKRAEILRYHDLARKFWADRLEKANAD